MSKRINYIDNLRWLTVSLLILYHSALAYNTWGEANYIFFEQNKPLAAIVSFISPWFMPLMFLLAGASSYFSLQKRSVGTFIKERFIRLGIPFVFGLLVIDPVLSYVADVTHNDYSGGYFEHYGVFFSRFTDLTGYDGGFTLGHFWFLGVLILISLVSCFIVKALGEVSGKKRAMIGVILCLLAVGTFDVSFFGKRIPTYLFVYLLGYYFVSDNSFAEKLSKGKWLFVLLFLGTSAANTAIFIFIGGLETLNTVCNYAAFTFALPALICIGHDRLDDSNGFTRFNSRISYIFYIVHFPVSVMCQYILGSCGIGGVANFLLTLVIAYPLTYALCFAIDKTRYLRVLFGSKLKNTG